MLIDLLWVEFFGVVVGVRDFEMSGEMSCTFMSGFPPVCTFRD